MTLYDYPVNISNMSQLMIYLSTSTSGWFGTLIALAIFCVTFFSLKGYPTSRAFAGASFITFIVISFFRILGLVGDLVLISGILLVTLGVIFLIADDSKDY